MSIVLKIGMFVIVAEEERLKFRHPPDKTPELFEKYLPYALALAIGRAGIAALAGVPGTVARSAAASVRVSAQRWRHPSRPRGQVPAAAAEAGVAGNGVGQHYPLHGLASDLARMNDVRGMGVGAPFMDRRRSSRALSRWF